MQAEVAHHSAKGAAVGLTVEAESYGWQAILRLVLAANELVTITPNPMPMLSGFSVRC